MTLQDLIVSRSIAERNKKDSKTLLIRINDRLSKGWSDNK